MSKDVTKDMTTGKPLLLILQFAFPLLIGNFFQQMYNVADAAIVGRFLGPKALAAVGASSSVQFLVLGFCIGICCGFGVPIAQRFGGKDYRSMRAYIWHSIFITIAAAVLLTTICVLLCPAILHILTTPANIYKDAYIYLLIIFLGIPCTLLYNLLSSILRAVGDSKTPFLFLVFSTILNIILDLVCIVVFHWGCAGAALFLLETLLKHVDSIDYLQSRLDGWTQDLDRMTSQTKQSLYAIGSGGATGLGLGNSIEKQLWLPESTNDFIFSVVCEELGFVGAVIVIVLFVLFLVQGFWIAFHAENRFCTLVGIGIMAQIAWQVFCNIAVVTNTLPNTGISLPFFSSGGTSLILLLAEMGVMVNIGRNGERAAQQRAAAHAQRQAAKAQRDAELKDRTINLDDARRARNKL